MSHQTVGCAIVVLTGVYYLPLLQPSSFNFLPGGNFVANSTGISPENATSIGSNALQVLAHERLSIVGVGRSTKCFQSLS